MAGIGFELRRILEKDSYAALLKAYAYSGMISAGPWVLSIVGILIIGILSVGYIFPAIQVEQYLISVTYLMAASLITTGLVQLLFTRFVSDRLFEQQHDIIIPNLFGVILVTTATTGTIGVLLALFVFYHNLVYEVLMVSNFVILSNLWLVVIFLSGMKEYQRIVNIMAIGYTLLVGSSYLLRPLGMNGLLLGFLIGHAFLLFTFMFYILRGHPTGELVAFHFLKRRYHFISLAFIGLFYNLGVWADKIIFWFTPVTSNEVIAPLRASAIYDFPIFLAYLAIIPGMAVFLVRMETDFAEHYEQFYESVREGDTLKHIYGLKEQMVFAAKQGVYEIFKVQGITVVLLLLWSKELLQWLGISPLYVHLFQVDLVGVSVQVLVMALLNVMFYLDVRKMALGVTVFFFCSNSLLTWLSIQLGAEYFGYGFATSMVLTAALSLYLLDYKFNNLEYHTFMLQR